MIWQVTTATGSRCFARTSVAPASCAAAVGVVATQSVAGGRCSRLGAFVHLGPVLVCFFSIAVAWCLTPLMPLFAQLLWVLFVQAHVHQCLQAGTAPLSSPFLSVCVVRPAHSNTLSLMLALVWTEQFSPWNNETVDTSQRNSCGFIGLKGKVWIAWARE